MRTQRTVEIYRDYVVAHGLERPALLESLHAKLGEAVSVLYPGCFVHLTPSFYFQHVVYVDRSDFARSFFADAEDVQHLVNAHRRYRQRPFVRFLAHDFTTDLPVAENSFDLVLALYAGGISRACTRYLREGGLVVSNDHQGDAGEAAELSTLSLMAVMTESRGKVQYIDSDLDGYLKAARPSARPRPAPSSNRKYQRSAGYYVFRKLRA